MIAAMPAASTCQHRHISEVALVLGHNQRRLPRVSAKRKPEGLIEESRLRARVSVKGDFNRGCSTCKVQSQKVHV